MLKMTGIVRCLWIVCEYFSRPRYLPHVDKNVLISELCERWIIPSGVLCSSFQFQIQRSIASTSLPIFLLGTSLLVWSSDSDFCVNNDSRWRWRKAIVSPRKLGAPYTSSSLMDTIWPLWELRWGIWWIPYKLLTWWCPLNSGVRLCPPWIGKKNIFRKKISSQFTKYKREQWLVHWLL
jgi:hypothetical protein